MKNDGEDAPVVYALGRCLRRTEAYAKGNAARRLFVAGMLGNTHRLTPAGALPAAHLSSLNQDAISGLPTRLVVRREVDLDALAPVGCRDSGVWTRSGDGPHSAVPDGGPGVVAAGGHAGTQPAERALTADTARLARKGAGAGLQGQ